MLKFNQLYAQIAQAQNQFTPAFNTRCKHYAHKGLTARTSECGLVRIIDCREGKHVKWSAAHRVGHDVVFGGISAQDFDNLQLAD